MMLVIPRLIILFLSTTFAVFAKQGTMTSEEVETSQAEASISGVAEEDIDLRIEEVQLEEERLEEEKSFTGRPPILPEEELPSER